MTPSPFLTEVVVRVLHATRHVDSAYQLFDRARSELVAAAASDRTLTRFNDYAYGRSGFYNPAASSFRGELFPWEEDVFERFFPPPPARVAVGGAGGGREVFALLERGYSVVAFEPSEELAAAMAAAKPPDGELTVLVGGYEGLPHLRETDDRPTKLEEYGPFDAALLGWGSFSHLRSESVRIATLRSIAQTTSGPIVASFLAIRDVDSPPRSRRGRLRRAIPRRSGREFGDRFSVFIGFFHATDPAEVNRLAKSAGLEVVHAIFDERDTNWPHVVFAPSAERA